MSSNPSERGIRGITRGHLIRTGISAATIGLSPLLSSCLIDSRDKARANAWAKDPSTAPTVIAGLRTPAAGPKPGSPTPRIEPTRTPERLLDTLEGQAKTAAFVNFFQALNSTRDVSDNLGRKTVASTIVNKASLGNFPQTRILHGTPAPQDTDLLQVQWIYSEPGFPSGINKTFGQGEVKNIKIPSVFSKPLTDADKANGIQWSGTVSISFIQRYRLAVANLGYTESEWAKKGILEPTIPLTPWGNGDFSTSVTLQNGNWKIDGTKDYPIQPSRAQSTACIYGPVPGCQVFDLRG